jgi:hypothetical protein
MLQWFLHQFFLRFYINKDAKLFNYNNDNENSMVILIKEFVKELETVKRIVQIHNFQRV